ncbi:hypothetical protein ACFL3Z_01900 [Gemmatimonadota bacterium]
MGCRLSLFLILATLFAGFAQPAGLKAQEPPDTSCVECRNVLEQTYLYHITYDEGEDYIDMDKQQTGEHSNESGCDEEPHGNMCLENCWNSHEWCESQEDLVALIEAIESPEPWDFGALPERPLITFNSARNALQVMDSCSGRVILHVPVVASTHPFRPKVR